MATNDAGQSVSKKIALQPRKVIARIFENDPIPQRLPSNRISTTKYNFLNFLPISLLIQFTKLANCFYLVSAVLQSIPSISTNDPLATVIPLMYVVILGMVKEFIADYKRYQNDKKENNYPSTRLILENGQWKEKDIPTHMVAVGDILRIRDDQIIPADCVVLASHSKAVTIDESVPSECFTKTQSLDGETNLKPKLPVKAVNQQLKNPDATALKTLTVDAPSPDPDLYGFKGQITLQG